MINEKQLKEWERIANGPNEWPTIIIDEKRMNVLKQLIEEVRRLNKQLSDSVAQGFYHGKTIMEDKVSELEKEADWLASQCEKLNGYNPILRQGMSKEQWRDVARKNTCSNTRR